MKKGVTLLELILVLVIVAIGASLAVPKLRISIEHREAKAALGTLQSISHAVRMFEVTKDRLPTSLAELEITDPATGTHYLDSSEYAPDYDFCINTGTNPVVIRADSQNYNRVITLTQSAIKSQDGSVTDSAGFLGLANAPPACG
jgi:prepilin-type N-terminal cleavage/methylation domain-containing protein